MKRTIALILLCGSVAVTANIAYATTSTTAVAEAKDSMNPSRFAGAKVFFDTACSQLDDPDLKQAMNEMGQVLVGLTRGPVADTQRSAPPSATLTKMLESATTAASAMTNAEPTTVFTANTAAVSAKPTSRAALDSLDRLDAIQKQYESDYMAVLEVTETFKRLGNRDIERIEALEASLARAMTKETRDTTKKEIGDRQQNIEKHKALLSDLGTIISALYWLPVSGPADTRSWAASLLPSSLGGQTRGTVHGLQLPGKEEAILLGAYSVLFKPKKPMFERALAAGCIKVEYDTATAATTTTAAEPTASARAATTPPKADDKQPEGKEKNQQKDK